MQPGAYVGWVNQTTYGNEELAAAHDGIVRMKSIVDKVRERFDMAMIYTFPPGKPDSKELFQPQEK